MSPVNLNKQSNEEYPPIENLGMIGNMRTVALSGMNGSIDFLCYPAFDSPSIFCRLLDHKKGGHFSLVPKKAENVTIKQQYLPQTNILSTRFLDRNYSVTINDYMPHPITSASDFEVLPWIIRHLTVTRGRTAIDIQCFPAFNYGQDSHITTVLPNKSSGHQDDPDGFVGKNKVEFRSQGLNLDLRYLIKRSKDIDTSDDVKWEVVDSEVSSSSSPGVVGSVHLEEGQELILVLRHIPDTDIPTLHPDFNICRNNPVLSLNLLNRLLKDTYQYWQGWIRKCTYKGRWREQVNRSIMTLKMLTYAPTGSMVAAPTFSLPEFIGGTRNWDYRFTWIRDASFTIYAFLRIGFVDEAKAYMKYIEKRLDDVNSDGSLNIMYDIHGGKELTELELPHLDGYRQSKPVRIGNGAADHLQMDIYGELMDAIYLYNKFGSPIAYDMWVKVRKLVDFVCANWQRPDMSIWEVRNQQQNFLYSKVLCWVAVDRGLRLAEKRTLPCPNRNKWTEVRDTIYEEIMDKGYNKELNMFQQSFESKTTLDSAILIMPLVFFISPTDPRLLNTIQRILLPPEKGGLVANGMVYRYNHLTSDDGVGGEEGSFSMCTFWLVEALTRAGKYDPKFLPLATNLFEQMLGYANHLSLYSEEIAPSGEALGNFPQAFTHIALISAAFNLNRVLE